MAFFERPSRIDVEFDLEAAALDPEGKSDETSDLRVPVLLP